MNWKLLSEEVPAPGSCILIDTGERVHLGWVLEGEAPAGFERWCEVTRHDGTRPERPRSYADGLTLTGYGNFGQVIPDPEKP